MSASRGSCSTLGWIRQGSPAPGGRSFVWPGLRALIGASVVVMLGCESSAARGPSQATESAASHQGPDDTALYDRARRVEVSIELDAADWQRARFDGLSAVDWVSRDDHSYDYASFEATVSVDGVAYPGATLRKKGFIGSVSALRPSLRIDLAGSDAGAEGWAGARRLTLNNDRQDPSHTHECMAFGAFERAGLPAPRCNLAHLVVNWEDLGTYSDVEPIRKPMLRRFFASDAGNLYEGQLSDFDRARVDGMELDTNEAQADRSDLEAVVSALEQADEGLVERLGALIDLPKFRRFWALETLLGHWDGYAGNANNYYAYHDPTSDRFVFIPWGTDQAFTSAASDDALNAGAVVYAQGLIARRLYGLPDERALYRAELAQLVQDVWNPSELGAEVEQIAALAGDIDPELLLRQRSFVQERGDVVLAALREPAPEWVVHAPAAERVVDACTGHTAAASGSFSTTWQASPELPPEPGEFSLALDIQGASVPLDFIGVAGENPEDQGATRVVRLFALQPGGRLVLVQFGVPPEQWAPGEYALHSVETTAFIGMLEADLTYAFLGVISDGSITFEDAGSMPGAPVSGRFTGRFYQVACPPSPP